jgi:uncharacterized membrane-anchored protein
MTPRRNLLTAAFVVLALIQAAVPLFMIARREATLRDGVQYKFRTAPVDPADPFRGRYVALRMEQESVVVPSGADFRRGERVFAVLEQTPDGFARLGDVSRTRPGSNAYIKARVRYPQSWGSTNTVSLDLPFDRYYMNEKQAPKAEQAYWQHSRRTSQTAYITVRVKSGSAVLENLYIGDKKVEDYIKQ